MPTLYYQIVAWFPITLVLCVGIYLTYTSRQKLKFLAASLLSIFSLHFILLPILALVILGKDGLDNDEHFDKVLLLSAFLQIAISVPFLFWLSKAFKKTIN